MVANKYAFLQITRRRFLNEWEAFKKVISRRNIRRRITIPLTLSNLKLLRRITRTENILHRNFTRRQVAIQNRVASNIGISQSTFSVKVLNLFSRSRRKTNKRKSKHSAMLRSEERRVGKEWRSRPTPPQEKKQRPTQTPALRRTSSVPRPTRSPSPRPASSRPFFFSSRRRHTRSVSAFLLNRSSDLCHTKQGRQQYRYKSKHL